MASLVVVGACYLDTILTVPYYPHEDEKLRVKSLSKRRGGNGPNTLEVLTQLLAARHRHEALSLSLCSVLPSETSAAVDLVKASLGPAVDLSACIYRGDRTEAASSYIIQSVESGSRTLVNYNDLPELTLQEFEVVSEKSVNAFKGRIPDVIQGCIRHLRNKFPNTIVSVEVEKPGRAGLEELAAEADVVFYSQSWAKVFFQAFLTSTPLLTMSQSKGYSTREECLRAQALVAKRAKDMRRVDLVIPYVPPQEESKPDFGSTFTSTMPMAAMFTRNRAIGWVSLLTALLNWLGETPAQKASQATPGYMSFGISILALGVTYMSLFLPPTPTGRPNAPVANPFAEADDDTGETKQAQNYIHIRIQQRNGRKTLTTVQGLPKKFDQKKILKVIKKKFACNGTIVTDSEMGEVIQLQGDQRKDVQEFLVAKDGLELDAKTIKESALTASGAEHGRPASRSVLRGGQSSALSARHPRVAVALGVDHVWHLPLLLCRALSITSPIWWTCTTLHNIYKIWGRRQLQDGSSPTLGGGDDAGHTMLFHRLLVAQLALSFVWAGTSAYLAHIFASSLMSRWLLHYSPLAVLLRLCSVSILLSYVSRELFRSLGATQADLLALSRSLPIWIVIAIALLVIYFSIQQDISLERDKDDRRRRLILRMKCLYAVAISSLSSLLVVIALIHFSTASFEKEMPSWIADCLGAGGLGTCLRGIGKTVKTEL
ncbi:hypothetical protein DV735_g3946, partial [Chaetothyriales sp. CBS 134920]